MKTMDLILWRHADARDLVDGQADVDRPLTAKGERQAQRMAQWLQRHLPETTRVLVSPTLRTRQTADRLDRRYKLAPGLAPDQTVDTLLGLTRWPDAPQPVLVVGHQQTLGLTAAYLMAGVVQPWALRKGAVWWLRAAKLREPTLADASPSGEPGLPRAVLHAVMAPDRV